MIFLPREGKLRRAGIRIRIAFRLFIAIAATAAFMWAGVRLLKRVALVAAREAAVARQAILTTHEDQIDRTNSG